MTDPDAAPPDQRPNLPAAKLGWLATEEGTAPSSLAHVARAPSVDTCCSYLNFHADKASTQAWATAHPDILGTILDQSSALALGQATFGPILTAPT